ncbi:MAG: ABC transporter substrate-binding protein [Acetobacteraceae bacterium]
MRAQDVVPSIRRFAARDAFGRALMDATAELTAPSDRVVEFRLHQPFPLLPNALGKTGTAMPAIMPERLALTDPYTQVTEVIGSGPFRFKTDEHVSGSQVIYERFDGYVPRTGGSATFTAGPKVAHLDRVEWHVIPDPATSEAALSAGEMDWWQQVTPDLLPLLRRNKDLTTQLLDPGGAIGILRFNELDNPGIRRALLGAIDQDEFMTAVAGDDRTLWKDRVGVFSPGTPLATEAGIEVLTGKRDLPAVRQALLDAGYRGERVALMTPSNYPDLNPLGLVAADVLKRVGMNVDLQEIEWGSLLQRRASRQPIDKGGWNAFVTTIAGTNNFDPASQLGIRGNGDRAWFGWPRAPKLEALRDAWFAAPESRGAEGGLRATATAVLAGCAVSAARRLLPDHRLQQALDRDAQRFPAILRHPPGLRAVSPSARVSKTERKGRECVILMHHTGLAPPARRGIGPLLRAAGVRKGGQS